MAGAFAFALVDARAQGNNGGLPLTSFSPRAARIGLAVLTLINLFNYLDRYVVASLVESLKKAPLNLSDTQLGSLMTGFVLVYMLTSPIFGTLGDRRGRPRLLALALFGAALFLMRRF